MIDSVPDRLRNPRTLLVWAVVIAGAVAWMAVAWASSHYLDFSQYLGLVGIGITIGSIEVAFLVWRAWAVNERTPAAVSAGAACAGSLMILVATLGGVKAQGFVLIATGVGLLGMACAAGLYGLYRGAGRTTAATVVAVGVIATLAYFSSLLWEAVP